MARAALRLAGARALALLAVASVALLPLVSSDDGYEHCEGVARGWADSSTGREKDGDKLCLKDLLFILHISRTGGRTYFHCFLKKLYPNVQECPRSYDKLRFDPRLDQMLYVGLTEDHEESVRLFAHMVGAQVLSQSGTLNLDLKEDLPSENDSHPSMVEPEDEETKNICYEE